jgi:hypothetical protein
VRTIIRLVRHVTQFTNRAKQKQVQQHRRDEEASSQAVRQVGACKSSFESASTAEDSDSSGPGRPVNQSKGLAEMLEELLNPVRPIKECMHARTHANGMVRHGWLQGN